MVTSSPESFDYRAVPDMAKVPPKVPLGFKALGVLAIGLAAGVIYLRQDPVGRRALDPLFDALPLPMLGFVGALALIWLETFWRRHQRERARILADLARAELRLGSVALTFQTTRGAGRTFAYHAITKAEVSRPSDGAQVLTIDAQGKTLRLTEDRFESSADFTAFHEALLARLSFD